MTEQTLVQAAQAGQTEAADQLIERYYARVYSFVATLHAGDVEDLTQEVFARALSALPRFSGEYQFGAWLLQIARNVCIDEARRKSHRPQPTDPVDLVGLEDVDDQLDDVWESVASQMAVKTVHRALDRLPKRQKTVLVLRELEGMSYADIAISLRISTRAVEISLSRARKRMRLELKRQELVEGELAACRRVVTLLASDPNAALHEDVVAHLRDCRVCQAVAGRRRGRDMLHGVWLLAVAGSSGLATVLRKGAAWSQAAAQNVAQTLASSPTTTTPLQRLAEVGAGMAVVTAVSAGALTGSGSPPARVIPKAVPIVDTQAPVVAPAAVPAAPPVKPPAAATNVASAPPAAVPTSAATGSGTACASQGSSSPDIGSAGGGLLGTGPLLSQLLTPLQALTPVLHCDLGATVSMATVQLQSTLNNLAGAPAGSSSSSASSSASTSAGSPASGNLLGALLGGAKH